jgi:hypothetical protein
METARFHRDKAELCLVMAGQMNDPLAASMMRAASARHSECADELANADRHAGTGRRCDIAPSHPSLPLLWTANGDRVRGTGATPERQGIKRFGGRHLRALSLWCARDPYRAGGCCSLISRDKRRAKGRAGWVPRVFVLRLMALRLLHPERNNGG